MMNQRKIYYEKKEMNYYRNNMKEIYDLENYLDPMSS